MTRLRAERQSRRALLIETMMPCSAGSTISSRIRGAVIARELVHGFW